MDSVENMQKYTLARLLSTKHGTFGMLVKDGLPFCLTLEPIDPIIPPGTYTCRRRYSFKRKYEVYQLVNVPGHDYVQIHKMNVYKQSEGCIGVGMGWYPFDPIEIPTVGLTERTMGLSNSKTAFTRIMKEQEGDILLEVLI